MVGVPGISHWCGGDRIGDYPPPHHQGVQLLCVQLLDQWAVGDPTLLMGVCNAHPPRDSSSPYPVRTIDMPTGERARVVSAATAGFPKRAAPG